MAIKTSAPAAALTLLLAGSASAQPPSGFDEVLGPSILCDTRVQLQSIIDAYRQGAHAGTERLAELFSLPNRLGEPTCAISSAEAGLVIGSESLGRIEIGGEDFYGWVVQLKRPGLEGYYLYLESRDETVRKSI